MNKEQKNTKNLYQRLSAVIQEMPVVQKAGDNKFQGYKYAREVDILIALKPLLCKHGLMLIPNPLDVSTTEVVGSKGQKGFKVDVKIAYTIVNIDNPEDKINLIWPGSGVDQQEKGLYKAYTGSMKYFLMKTFLVASDEDPENDKFQSFCPVSPVKQPAPQKPSAQIQGELDEQTGEIKEFRFFYPLKATKLSGSQRLKAVEAAQAAGGELIKGDIYAYESIAKDPEGLFAKIEQELIIDQPE